MIPEKVRFTGLTIPATSLLFGYEGRKFHGVPPAKWQRVEIQHDSADGRELDRIDSWLSKNIEGRWASFALQHGAPVVVFIEDDNDALVFKLKGGETAWRDELDGTSN